ncbi:MAG: hypothetical protein KDD34_01095 [Bdellovibrionales bacterium]|nr:hypothetical protein [Bdellovibrionales bacterium]
MSHDTSFSVLKELIENQHLFSEALRQLKSGREIKVLIDGQHECALFFSQEHAILDDRPAKNPDVEFTISTEALRLLQSLKYSSLAELGVEIVKQIIVGNIQLRVCTGLLAILNGGYFKIIKLAGPEFMGFLAQNGLKNLNKIKSLVNTLRK